jgi:hypothetical protein
MPKARFAFFVLFIVVCSIPSVVLAAQEFTVSNVPGDGGRQLTVRDCGGEGIPDGQGMVYIYWDADGNGPSSNDHLAPICSHPATLCPDGPNGSVNYNSFLINGEELLGIAGGFTPTDYIYLSWNGPNPYRIFVKVQYPVTNPTIEWVSNVIGVPYLHPWDCLFESWTPHMLSDGCPDASITYLNPDPSVGPQNQSVCVQLCSAEPHSIYVGPLPQQDRIPHITVSAGCATCNLPVCAPATGIQFNPDAWTWFTNSSGQHYYVNTLTLNGDSCANYGVVTLNLDGVLPVEMGTVSFTPLDQQVRVHWNTLSESNLERFDIVRDGSRIGSRNATNNATGADYEFTDESVENGRTYHYELVVVNLDNSTETVAQESVTPQMGIGVVSEFALYQNYPNPFNPITQIVFDLAEAENVSLKVFNLMGQPVAELVKGNLSSGHHAIAFDAKTLPSGVYVYQLTAGSFHAQKKMLLMK